MYGNPNMNERADMIGRALAKETDGDFTKFVAKTGKPRDMAQKWRAFKNIARFFKHPLGYIYWKTQPYRTNNRVRIIWVLMCYHLYQSFLLYVICKNKKENMKRSNEKKKKKNVLEGDTIRQTKKRDKKRWNCTYSIPCL